MSNVVELAKYRKTEPPAQITAAYTTVEYMRKQMYELPSTQARIEYAQCIMAQLVLWIIKSNHYENPTGVIKTWVEKKCQDYSKKRSGE